MICPLSELFFSVVQFRQFVHVTVSLNVLTYVKIFLEKFTNSFEISEEHMC